MKKEQLLKYLRKGNDSFILAYFVTLVPSAVYEYYFLKWKSVLTVFLTRFSQCVQCLAVLAGEHQEGLLLPVVWNVRKDVNGDMLRGKQLGVHRGRLALHFPGMLHYVNLSKNSKQPQFYRINAYLDGKVY